MNPIPVKESYPLLLLINWELNHPYAYEMQYSDAYDDVVEWLEQHDYIGELDKAGFFDGVAVYALYDELRISYKEILAELKKEAERQAH